MATQEFTTIERTLQSMILEGACLCEILRCSADLFAPGRIEGVAQAIGALVTAFRAPLREVISLYRWDGWSAPNPGVVAHELERRFGERLRAHQMDQETRARWRAARTSCAVGTRYAWSLEAMDFDDLQPIDRADFASAAAGNVAEVRAAVIRASLFEPDRTWMEDQLAQLLQHLDRDVRAFLLAPSLEEASTALLAHAA